MTEAIFGSASCNLVHLARVTDQAGVNFPLAHPPAAMIGLSPAGFAKQALNPGFHGSLGMPLNLGRVASQSKSKGVRSPLP